MAFQMGCGRAWVAHDPNAIRRNGADTAVSAVRGAGRMTSAIGLAAAGKAAQ